MPENETTQDLTAKLVLLIADGITLPPDPDRVRQIFNTAAELRRCMAGVGEFDEAAAEAIEKERHGTAFYAILGALQDEDVDQPDRTAAAVLFHLRHAGLKIIPEDSTTPEPGL